MPKVTFHATPVVYIIINVESEDSRTVQRFIQFLLDESIFCVIPRSEHIAVASYCGFFFAEDAYKIEKWLLEQGAKPAR